MGTNYKYFTFVIIRHNQTGALPTVERRNEKKKKTIKINMIIIVDSTTPKAKCKGVGGMAGDFCM